MSKIDIFPLKINLVIWLAYIYYWNNIAYSYLILFPKAYGRNNMTTMIYSVLWKTLINIALVQKQNSRRSLWTPAKRQARQQWKQTRKQKNSHSSPHSQESRYPPSAAAREAAAVHDCPWLRLECGTLRYLPIYWWHYVYWYPYMRAHAPKHFTLFLCSDEVSSEWKTS